MQISEINFKSPKYPGYLREIANPPRCLYVVGELPTAQMIAIVGSRKPSQYGTFITHQLAYELAQAGFVIVSGLAYGIDAVAHLAALDAKGSTIAVLGSGLDQIYPVGNQNLAKRILVAGGVLVSEQDRKSVV